MTFLRKNFFIGLATLLALSAICEDLFFGGDNSDLFRDAILVLSLTLIQYALWLSAKQIKKCLINSCFLGFALFQFLVSLLKGGGGIQLYPIVIGFGMFISLFLQFLIWLFFAIKALHKKLSRPPLPPP